MLSRSLSHVLSHTHILIHTTCSSLRLSDLDAQNRGLINLYCQAFTTLFDALLCLVPDNNNMKKNNSTIFFNNGVRRRSYLTSHFFNSSIVVFYCNIFLRCIVYHILLLLGLLNTNTHIHTYIQQQYKQLFAVSAIRLNGSCNDSAGQLIVVVCDSEIMLSRSGDNISTTRKYSESVPVNFQYAAAILSV